MSKLIHLLLVVGLVIFPTLSIAQSTMIKWSLNKKSPKFQFFVAKADTPPLIINICAIYNNQNTEIHIRNGNKDDYFVLSKKHCSTAFNIFKIGETASLELVRPGGNLQVGDKATGTYEISPANINVVPVFGTPAERSLAPDQGGKKGNNDGVGPGRYENLYCDQGSVATGISYGRDHGDYYVWCSTLNLKVVP